MGNRSPRSAVSDLLTRMSSKVQPGDQRNVTAAGQDQSIDEQTATEPGMQPSDPEFRTLADLESTPKSRTLNGLESSPKSRTLNGLESYPKSSTQTNPESRIQADPESTPKACILNGLEYSHKSSTQTNPESRTQTDPEFPKSRNIGLQLLAGGIAGATSRTVTAPIDRLKVMLQVSGSKHSTLSNCAHTMMKEGGMKSLWRGNFMNVLKVTPESAIKFSVHEKLIQGMRSSGDGVLSHQEQIFAGMIAGAVSQTAIFPLDVLKTRLAIARTGEYRGMVDCACQLYRTQGARGFYRGVGVNILGAAVYAGIEMPLYGKLRGWYQTRGGNDSTDSTSGNTKNTSKTPSKNLPTHVTILITAAASICGQFAAYPFALLRTKLQAQRSEARRYGTARSLLRHVLRTHGVTGLYRGLVPNMLKAVPAICITYLVVEQLNRQMGIEKSF